MRYLKHFSKYFLGLYQEGGLFYAAGLKKEGNKTSIVFLKKGKLDFKELLGNKEWKIISGLSAKEALLRQTAIKLHKRGLILKTLPFQMQALFPFNEEESVGYPIITKDYVDLVGAKKEDIKAHLLELEKEGIDPDSLDFAPLGLLRFIDFYHKSSNFLAFYIGESEVLAIGVKNKRLLFTTTLSLNKFKQNLSRFEGFVKEKYEKNPFEEFFITGRKEEETEKLIGSLFGNIKKNPEPCALAIGLALTGTKAEFRYGPFASKKAEKKENFLIKAYGLFCFSLFAIAFLFFSAQEKKVLQSIAKRLSSYEIEGSKIEPKIEEIAKAVSLWDKKLSKKSVASFEKSPKAQHFLVWLEKQNLKEGSIQKINYRSEGNRTKVELIVTPSDLTAFETSLKKEMQEVLFTPSTKEIFISFYLKEKGDLQ